MATSSKQHETEHHERKKVAQPLTAPSQYLFAADRLLEHNDPDGQVRVSNRFQWILTNINFTLGLGPLWRFPTVALRDPAGSFVCAYILIFIIVGYPLALMEVALGQSTKRRAATVFKLCTAIEGLSICMGVYSFIIPIYYHVIFAYGLYYLYYCFDAVPRWTKCEKYMISGYNCTEKGMDQQPNGTFISAEEVFWNTYVLDGIKGDDDPIFTPLNWWLLLCLIISWTIPGILLVYKIRKLTLAVEYFLIPLTMVVLILVMIMNVFLVHEKRREFMAEALKDFFLPKLEMFHDIQLWKQATEQVFFSLGVGSGPLITLGSLSHFKSRVHIDSGLVCLINLIFSLICGIALFYSVRVLSNETGQNLALAHQVNLFGSGIYFIGFTKILGELPVPQLWTVLFLILFISLGARAVMGLIDTTVSVVRFFVPLGNQRRFKFQLSGVLVIVASFCLGLLVIMKGDTLMFIVLDYYGGATVLTLLATIESIGVIWIYGVTRFSDDIQFMLDYKPNIVLRIIWVAIPVYLVGLITVSWLHSFVDQPLGNILPTALIAFGWILIIIIVLPLCVHFTVQFIVLQKKKRLNELFKSKDDVGPDDLQMWYRDEHFFDRISLAAQSSD